MFDSDSDQAVSARYHREIRETNRRNPTRYDCPDCGRKGALSASDKAKGYHCSACTASLEGPGGDSGIFGDH
jgi:ribosomal protein L37AE/L43A